MNIEPAIKLDNDEKLALIKWYIEQSKLDQALLQIKSLLKEESPAQEAILLGARIYAQLRLHEKAEQLFAQYLEMDSGNIHVKFQHGMAQFDSGGTAEAISTWADILSIQPHNPPALFYSALAFLQNNKQEDGIKLLQTILTHIQTDNLYYGKAKELISNLERDPSFRVAANKVNSSDTNPAPDAFTTH